MTVIRMLVATVTTSLATKVSLCAVRTYNCCLGWRKWLYNLSIKLAPAVSCKDSNSKVIEVQWLVAKTATGK